MPIYEYVCERCETKSEFLDPVGYDGGHNCPECNCKKTNKVFSTFASRVKGGSRSSGGGSSCRSCRSGSCGSCSH
jgi:putative FmdB family regulatory protein